MKGGEAMQIRVDKNGTVNISGYVNAIERNSKPIWSRMGQFIERVAAGAFKNALKRNDDVRILLNHNWKRELGSTKTGNLKLVEDNIGLRAEATINDSEIAEKAKNGDLIGWSFGFSDRDIEHTTEHGMLIRIVRDLDLFEVSILDRSKCPAYAGTLITVREESNTPLFRAAEFYDASYEQGTTAEPKKEAELNYTDAEKILNEIKESLK